MYRMRRLAMMIAIFFVVDGYSEAMAQGQVKKPRPPSRTTTTVFKPTAVSGRVIPFMSLDEIRSRLSKGPVPAYFESVPQGTEMRRYEIIIQGIMNGPGVRPIVFTTKEIVVAGMSGSPVYVPSADGKTVKLLGAMAYSVGVFSAGERWGGIAPIEMMHQEASEFYTTLDKMLERRAEPKSKLSLPEGFVHNGMYFRPIPLGFRPAPMLADSGQSGGEVLSSLRDLALVSVSHSRVAGTAVPTQAPQKIIAGMPIMVEVLSWSDSTGGVTSVSGLGTITYVGPKGEVYAFGHSLMNAKFSAYRFRTCRILGSVLSEYQSFKMAGEFSEPLGMIGFDGDYGIYGVTKDRAEPSLGLLGLEFSWEDADTSRFKVLIARVPNESDMITMALKLVGDVAGALTVPYPGLVESTSQVRFRGLHIQDSVSHGIHASYEEACKYFLEKVYEPLRSNVFKVRPEAYTLSFRFTSESHKILYVAVAHLADKVVFGSVPELEIVLVNKNNSAVFSRRIKVPIDWTKTKEPVYGFFEKDEGKESDKIVRGTVNVYTYDSKDADLEPQNRKLESFEYFLNINEFMEVYTRSLLQTNEWLLVRASIPKRSDGAQALDADVTSVIPSGGRSQDGWTVHEKLTERRVQAAESADITFSAERLAVPEGYVLAPLKLAFQFEVVLEEAKKE